MRYRRLQNDDYAFGLSQGNFLKDSPDCVAQAVLTRMRLWRGSWFLDASEGIEFSNDVLGNDTAGVYDLAIQDRILGTQGVLSILAYDSNRNPDTRALSVQATIDTIYGTAQIVVSPQRTFVYPPAARPVPDATLTGVDGTTLTGADGTPLGGSPP